MKRANAVDITGDADTVDGLHGEQLDEKNSRCWTDGLLTW